MSMDQAYFRADMHCHSTCSDGSLAPKELVQLASQRDLQGLSITDHDSVEAYLQSDGIIAYGAGMGVAIIPGVELSCSHKGESVHVLAYSFNPKTKSLQDFCQRHRDRRKERCQEIFSKLTAKGMPITEAEVVETCALNNKSSIGRPHIAKTMVMKGYCVSIDEAFRQYIGSGRSCYAAGPVIAVEETLALIKSLNAFAVIAHPHLIKEGQVLTELLKMPFDGIECHYASFGMDRNKRWIKIANHHDWLQTGGSDFHGTAKPQNSLGSSWINWEIFKVLQERYQHNSLL